MIGDSRGGVDNRGEVPSYLDGGVSTLLSSILLGCTRGDIYGLVDGGVVTLVGYGTYRVVFSLAFAIISYASLKRRDSLLLYGR